MTEHPDADAATDDGAASGDMLTWRQLWSETATAIGDQMHARWMCETASSTEPDEFLAELDTPATERMVSHLDAMVARYRTGEPLQYVLGRWAFRHLDLAVDPRVLIPRPETELVADVAIQIAASCSKSRTLVDLGTGSGAIGLSAAHELPLNGTSVWLTDASRDALDVARANLAGVGRAAQNVRIAVGSWFEALPGDLVADVIVSNPPYVADHSDDLAENVSGWEPDAALFAGSDGLDDVRIIIDRAMSFLAPGGALVLEIGFDQGTAVSELLCAAGFTDVEIRPDLSGHDRIAIGRSSVEADGDLGQQRSLDG